ncbi:MAG: hypothetical protein NC328_06890 [Muribaculum sp.]|nr:hypothetical protein [Muribaculum sp.]
MKKTILKWILMTALICYAIGMAIWANARAADDVCTGIQVNILGDSKANSVTPASVMTQLAKCPIKIIGSPLGALNTLDVENYLKSFQNFEDVECVMNSQGKLTVNITPMIPEIRVFDGERSYYVNKDGKTIPSTAEFYTDVPLVCGHFSKALPATYVLPVTRFINSDPTLKNLISQIVVRDKDNIILVPRISGHVINFGDTADLARKRKALLTAYHKILPFRGWETYDTISVRFKRQIVATRRDKTPLHPILAAEEDANPEEAALAEQQSQAQQAGPPDHRQQDD